MAYPDPVPGMPHMPALPYQHLDAIVQQAQARGPIRLAVAYPCDASSLSAAIEAGRAGLVTPVLVGPLARIAAVAAS